MSSLNNLPLPTNLNPNCLVKRHDRTIVEIYQDTTAFTLMRKYFVSSILDLLQNELFDLLGRHNTGMDVVFPNKSSAYKELIECLEDGEFGFSLNLRKELGDVRNHQLESVVDDLSSIELKIVNGHLDVSTFASKSPLEWKHKLAIESLFFHVLNLQMLDHAEKQKIYYRTVFNNANVQRRLILALVATSITNPAALSYIDYNKVELSITLYESSDWKGVVGISSIRVFQNSKQVSSGDSLLKYNPLFIRTLVNQ